MSQTIQLVLVTPERQLLAEAVDEVILPGSEGYLGVLPGHAPLLTLLQPGELSYKTGGQQHLLAVSGGYAEVLRNAVTVLAETAEMAEEIDVARARRSQERAEGMLAAKLSAIEFEQAEVRLKRALNRIRVYQRRQG